MCKKINIRKHKNKKKIESNLKKDRANVQTNSELNNKSKNKFYSTTTRSCKAAL